MTATSSLVDAARRELSDLNDQITGAHDSGYEEARAVHNGMIDKRPAIVVRCSDPEEVARCIAFGRDPQPAGGGPRGRAQRRGPGLRRRRDRDRSRRDGRRRGRPWFQHGPCRGRRDLGPGRPRDGRARPRDALGDHLDDRRRRPHARRRYRPSDAALRAHDRQPDRRRRGAGRRLAGPRQRERASRSVLGAPRRRRELRRGDHVRVPDSSARRDRDGGADLLAGGADARK